MRYHTDCVWCTSGLGHTEHDYREVDDIDSEDFGAPDTSDAVNPADLPRTVETQEETSWTRGGDDMSDLYDYDDIQYGEDVYTSYGPETSAQLARQADTRPGSKYSVEIGQWEHELAQPNYSDYFLEETTR